MVNRRLLCWSSALTTAAMLWCVSPAQANGTPPSTTNPPPSGPNGDADNNTLKASASQSQIQITYKSGGNGGGEQGNLTTIDPNWEPPPCWYEPVFTPEELKEFVDKTDGSGDVGALWSWYGKGLWTDHYKDGKSWENNDNTTAEGYKNYNIGKGGHFWRSVENKNSDGDPWDCGKLMFWQPENEIPNVPNAPTAETLAEYVYNKVKVPDTKVELKPEAKSTVNLPTWAWLDKGTFKDVKVRAELPNTPLWAETTATPKSLHLEPGTKDAETFPASGECKINDDGSIGTPYTKGKSKEDPPCGIKYLRATGGDPFQLKASITWEISWEGTGGAGDTMPNGTFETTQDMNVQEIQSINR